MRAYDPLTAQDKRGFRRAIDTLRTPYNRERYALMPVLGLHPLVRITLYVVLFWYAKDLVEQIVWRLT